VGFIGINFRFVTPIKRKMILSKSCEYAIRATVYVALKSQKSEKTGIIEVAKAIGSPMHFTGKILQTLVRKKILSSAKGPNGGFFVENGQSLFLIDIIRAIDGNGCLLPVYSASRNVLQQNPAPCMSKLNRSGICYWPNLANNL
jgi:Rrf2 family protein